MDRRYGPGGGGQLDGDGPPLGADTPDGLQGDVHLLLGATQEQGIALGAQAGALGASDGGYGRRDRHGAIVGAR
ncbi:hypothetical protein GCM10017674_04460 [Streptomyces gardneri]|uniref:Uncharacterized protein n=1 Tax=Streptomyces gardneri TaxID=66892 RepID=A0A4Y3RNV3_9ACTN|nr:hypothetical protein SGA01_42630 [Streptomyces gardneri]GHG82651.1 hypothetical protein GCM10017674_04460 [Streptomyces gardneri]